MRIEATDQSQTNATVKNTAESSGDSIYGASGMAGGAIVASNLVLKKLTSHLDQESEGTTEVSGALAVQAADTSAVYANSKLTSSVMITNDGGVSVLENAISGFSDSDYTTAVTVPKTWILERRYTLNPDTREAALMKEFTNILVSPGIRMIWVALTSRTRSTGEKNCQLGSCLKVLIYREVTPLRFQVRSSEMTTRKIFSLTSLGQRTSSPQASM